MLYSNTRSFKSALQKSNVSFGEKTQKVFEKIKKDLLLLPNQKYSDYVFKAYNSYKTQFARKGNNALNGQIFEMIFKCLLFQLDIMPIFYQVKVTYVSNIEFDFILFKKADFFDAKGKLLYNGVQPICISLKTSTRERYKQADLEAMALKNVHKNAKCYLIGLENVDIIRTKIVSKDTFGLDDVYDATGVEFDSFIDELISNNGNYILPTDVPVCLSRDVIQK